MKRKAVSQTIDFSLSDLEDSNGVEATSIVVEKFSKDHRRILQSQQNNILFSTSPSSTPPDTVFHDLSNIEPDLLGSSQGNQKKCRTRRMLLSDEPLKDWLPYRQQYLDELFWHEGRAGASPACVDCAVEVGPKRLAAYRCQDCGSCRMLCDDCLVARHLENPFHRVQKWNGTSWISTTLRALGLRIQLGHNIFERCSRPIPAHSLMAVVHTNGIHSVKIDYCGCNTHAVSHRQQLLRFKLFPATVRKPRTCVTFVALETLHLQNVQSKCGVYDLYTSLERITDNTGLGTSRRCYHSVLRCLRQWKYLKMLKRAGRGHVPAGILSTQPGQLAVDCPACPHPGINVPKDLSTVPEKDKWLYRLFTSIDACFRVKRYDVSSKEKDPILDDGLSYFVKDGPYKEELAKHGAQEEICTCTGLAALDHANTKFSKGYAATGVGACVCSRHKFIMKNGVGDLQKGEKYVNMDLIFCSAMRHHPKVEKLSTYDIVCQWIINLFKRLAEYPEEYHINVPSTSLLRWAIGKLHWYAHKQEGHSRFSLNWIPGVGRCDGEGIERRWWDIQPIANSVKMMGPGGHHAFLNDHWGYGNWRKTVTLIPLLCRKYCRAKISAAEQQLNLASLSQGISLPTRNMWIRQVEEWENDITKPDPYYVQRQELTEAEIRRQLTEAEEKAVREGVQVMVHDVSAVSMLIIGLDLEEQQAQLQRTPKGIAEQTKQLEQCTTLHRRIARFRDIQVLYMPIVSRKVATDPTSTRNPRHVATTPLFLPSALSRPDREIGCNRGLVDTEVKLRMAQCRDALEEIRVMIHVRMRLIQYKKYEVRHVGPNTRCNALIKSHDSKLNRMVTKYRRAWKAVVALIGEGDWQLDLKDLKQEDLRGLEDDDPETLKKKEAQRRKRRKKNKQPTPAEGNRIQSWIWNGASEGNNDYSSSLRLEWIKARARKLRWEEELQLLPEEVRRTIAFFEWKAAEWDRISKQREEFLAPEILEGLVAYADRQARLMRALAKSGLEMWQDTINPPKPPASKSQSIPPREDPGESIPNPASRGNGGDERDGDDVRDDDGEDGGDDGDGEDGDGDGEDGDDDGEGGYDDGEDDDDAGDDDDDDGDDNGDRDRDVDRDGDGDGNEGYGNALDEGSREHDRVVRRGRVMHGYETLADNFAAYLETGCIDVD